MGNVFRGLTTWCGLFFLFLMIPLFVKSEGTKELNPNPGDVGGLQIWDNGNRQFMSFGAPEDKRLNIHVNEPGEVVHMGFRQDNNDVFYRVYDPDGVLVIDNGSGGGVPLPTAGNPGYIDTYNEAIAGPTTLDPTGYDPISFTATKAGDYWIEFNPGSATTVNNWKRVFLYFDITVVNPSDPTIPQLGRLWSKEWDFSLLSFDNRFMATMFIYADDGIVTSIDFNGIQPFGFTIGANNSGLYNTGDVEEDRKSKGGQIGYLQYKLFLNDPDSIAYPTGQFGQITQPITISGCDPDTRCINVSVDKAGTVEVILDLNGVDGYQSGTEDVSIFTTVEVGDNCIPWNSRDGNGDLVPGGAEIPIEVNYYNGLTHLPLYDVEKHQNGYIVELHRPQKSNARPEMFWDDSEIGGTTELGGCSDPNGCHAWPSDWFGDGRTVNTWWYAEVLKDSADLNNNPIVLVDANTFVASAGNDTLVCLGTASLEMNGFVGGAPGGTWSTLTGGTFDDIHDMNTTYTFDNNEITNGLAELILVTDAFDDCPQREDTMRISFALAPEAIAGTNQTICKNNPEITLSGNINNATGAQWTSLGGVFADDTNLGTTYTPTQAEIDGGVTIISLTTTNNNGCPEDTDDLTVLFSESPVADAGNTFEICSGNDATLNGTKTNATAGTWSGGLGNFSPSNNIDDPTYSPHQDEIDAGNVTLTFTASSPGCTDESDQITITIGPTPEVDAGTDQNICSNNPTVTLNGNVTIATGGAWTSLGGGTFSNANSLASTYTASTTDVTNGSVKLVLTSTGNGDCVSTSDTVEIFFTPAPTAEAGNAQSLCSNNAEVSLNGQVTIATGGSWTSNGSGSFVPNANTLNATYQPSQADLNNGNVSLTLTTTGNGSCVAVNDNTNVTFTPEPTVDAGNPFDICENSPTGSFDASFTIAGGIEWSSTSGGTIADINDINSTYTLSAAEITAGTAIITATTINNGNCNAVSDQVVITVTPSPVIDIGSGQSICSNRAEINLSASFSNATGIEWTSSGSGTFTDNQALSTVYNSTPADTTAGSITITGTTTGNGLCAAVNEQITINYTPSPSININGIFSVCSNNSALVNGIHLNPSIDIASGGTWTTNGSGSFSPSANDFNASYYPSAADTAAGLITLSLTSTGNGNCNAVQNEVDITFGPSPTVNAGTAMTVCRDNPTVQLNGNVTGANGVIWTKGNGVFSPGNTSLSPTYTPTIDEMDAGSVNLKISTTGNGDCNPVEDFVLITITPSATANAGNNQTVCSSTPSIPLNGQITIAGGGVWSTSGSGTFNPNNTTLNASYEPSPQDILDETITLTLTTTNNGTCNETSDDMVITFTTLPSIDAGDDQIACDNDFPVQLDGSGSPATWSGGLGSFLPSANVHNARYIPDPSEVGNNVTLTLSTTASGGCPSIQDEVILSLQEGPSLDVDDNFSVCANDDDFTINAVNDNSTGVIWSTNGDGTFSNNTSLSPLYTLDSDDKLQNELNFYVETTGNGVCPASKDTIIISIDPEVTVFVGPNQTICSSTSSVSLNGIISNSTGGTWSSSGTGTFSPSPTDLSATYTLSANDQTTGFTLTLSSDPVGACPNITADKIYTITPEAIVDAGPSQTLCADAGQVNLSGTVSTTGGEWSTNGTGTFNNLSNLNTFYTPSFADTAALSVTLTLTSTGNGVCDAVSDDVIITFDPVPFVNAGEDINACANDINIPLNGTVLNASGGTWTSFGNGSFSNINNINSTFTPGATDISNGVVTLRLTSTGNGECDEETDNVNIFFSPVPTVDPGSDLVLCSDNGSFSLIGDIDNATGGTWSTSGSGNFDNSNNLNTFYTPTAADIASGITITLTSTGNDPCAAVSESIAITYDQKPVVDAGVDKTICADSSYLNLNASINNAGGGIWSTNSTGNFDNIIALDADYFPSTSDLSGSEIILYLTSTGNGACAPVEDSITFSILPAPEVDAGIAQTVCANQTTIALNGSFDNAVGLTWSTSGSGVFDDVTSTTATYTPSNLDTAALSVTLSATTTGNSICKAVSDQVQITFIPAPYVEAGPNQAICADVNNISFDATVYNTGGMVWSNTGTGAMTNKTTLQPTYFITDNDKSSGEVTFFLTSTLTGVCPEEKDTIVLTITPAPTIDAGNDQTICADTSGLQVNASYTIAGNVLWESSGTGSFFPSPLVNNPTYVPSSTDITDSTVVLTVTTQNMGSCIAIRDSINLYINPAPTVDAGDNIEVCATQDYVDINGTIVNAGSGQWSASGTGNFNVNGIGEDNAYTMSNTDRSAGTVSLTLTTTDNGFCNAVQDNLILTISPKPSVNAGQDKFVCADVDSVGLSGIIENAGGNFWESYGQGTFHPNTATASVKYIPDASDRAQDSVLLALYPTGVDVCDQNPDFVTIYFSTTPFISAGEDSIYCSNSLPISLNGSGANGAWRGGSGIFSPDTTALNAIYTPSAAEITAGSVQLTLHSKNNGSCAAAVDTVIFTLLPGPGIDIGNNHTVCADSSSLELSAAVNVATGVTWTTMGTGSFDDNNLSTTVYNFSSKDYSDSLITIFAETTGNGACVGDSDTLKIYINPAPTVSTGLDKTICETTSSINISGTFKNAGGVQWTTVGDGNFDNNNATSTNYNPGSNDISNLGTALYLTTTGNGFCRAVTDTIILTIDPLHLITSDDNISNCEDATSITLDATLTNATTGTWSTNGKGAFSPNPNNPTTTYVPTSLESVDGNSLDFIFTTQSNNACGSLSKITTLTFTGAPTVVAGPDQEVCANNPTLSVNGTFSGATGIEWSTTGTGVFDDELASSTNYTLSAAEINAGSVSLSITTTGNGDCQAYTDVLVVDVTPEPTVNAGPDISICADVNSINIAGALTVAKGIEWTTSGTGTFENNTSLSTKYFPSSSDSTNGTISLSIETTGNGLCNAVNDNAVVTLTTVPTIDAGNDTLICETHNSITLNVDFTVSGGVTWTSSGAGTFSPNANMASASYNISNTDQSNGKFGLTVTTIDNGTCQPVTDDLIVTLSPKPEIIKPANFLVCETTPTITLSASVNNATSINWTSSGAGSFNSNGLTAIYANDANDVTAGLVNFIATSTGNGVCDPVSESVSVSFQKIPDINAGPDLLVCAENTGITINASVQNATGGLWSTADGSGTFSAIDNLTTTYTSTNADTTAGLINLVLTSTGNGVCPAEDDTVTINFSPAPFIIIEPIVACEDQDSFTLNARVEHATGGSWNFNGTGGISPNNTDLNGVYFISPADIIQQEILFTLQSTGNGVCNTTSENMTAYIAPLPDVDVGEDQLVCVNTEATLETTAAPNQTYEWYDASDVLVDDEYLISPTISSNTSYYVVVTNAYGCQNSDSLDIAVVNPPALNMIDDICFTDSLIINSSPSGVPTDGRFQWFINDIYSFKNDDSTAVYEEGKGEYKVVFTIANCQVNDISKLHQPEPENKDSVEYCPRIDGTATLDAGPASAWLWTASGNTDRYEEVDSDGYYDFVIEDSFGCENTDSIKVVVICAPEVYVPTGLIPGNTEKAFGVTGKDFTNYTMMVFNRWGEVIYYSENPDETWDGTYRGEYVPAGVYPWVVKYEGITERFKGPYDDSGKVQVIR